MRRLAICTLLILTACSSPGLINYTDQPGTTCAPPIGKWTRTPTICVDDSRVYLSNGEFAGADLVQMCQGIADPVAREFVQYVHDIEPNINATFIGNIGYADIPVRLYDGRSNPSYKSTTFYENNLGISKINSDFSFDNQRNTAAMSELEKWLLYIGVTLIVAHAEIHGNTVGFDTTGTAPETEAAVMNLLNTNPPPADSGYNGMCYYTHRGDKITATSVWINVGGMPSRLYTEGYIRQVLRHELGHAVIGLNDNTPDSWNPPDDTPDGPGLMSYTGGWTGGWRDGREYPAGWFSFDEVDTIWWLYE